VRRPEIFAAITILALQTAAVVWQLKLNGGSDLAVFSRGNRVSPIVAAHSPSVIVLAAGTGSR